MKELEDEEKGANTNHTFTRTSAHEMHREEISGGARTQVVFFFYQATCGRPDVIYDAAFWFNSSSDITKAPGKLAGFGTYESSPQRLARNGTGSKEEEKDPNGLLTPI